MAQASTIYTASVELSHVDRGVYQALDLRLARHPSETAEFLITRLLAYCLEYEDGIAFGDGISAAGEPAVLVRDLTGRVTKWIEVGMPHHPNAQSPRVGGPGSAERVHRGHKLAGRAAVYTHRDLRQVLAQLDGRGVHRADEVPVYAFPRPFVRRLAAALDRRTAWTFNVIDGELYGDGPVETASALLVAGHFG
jgi:uncharacterized protein YaeQ